LNGAAVRVSMVGFDNGSEQERTLDGAVANIINADLTGSVNLPSAQRLKENLFIQFEGTKKGADFDVPYAIAQKMLEAPLNPNGRPNFDVVKPWANAMDITRRPRNMWIIDFGTEMPLEEAALYEMPFGYIEARVKPKYAHRRKTWWLHERPRPEMRRALTGLPRFLCTPRHSKYRLFVWFDGSTLPDSANIAFARDDDYFFGVLHSRPHELWALRMGTSLEDRPRYTPTTCFETFPFPWPPGEEPPGDSRIEEIAEAASRLDELRRNWLNRDGASEAELKKRTLTNLYNARPTWLENAHERLDEAVFSAYGWPLDLTEEEVLQNLLALNLERSEVH
jgi:type II restriction/modification system DNA methylase subunit YeeA